MPADPYSFKPEPFSSHTLVVNACEPGGGGRWILDVGCGAGYLAHALACRGYQVVGVDSDREALMRARAFCHDVIEADLDGWAPSLAQRFDCMIFADILEHLRDPARLLRALLPSLADQGVVIISMPNIAHLYARLMLLRGRWEYADCGLWDQTHLRFFTRASLLHLLREVGLRPLRIRASALPWSKVTGRLPAWVPRVASQVDHLASRLCPTLFAYQFVVSAAKEMGSNGYTRA